MTTIDIVPIGEFTLPPTGIYKYLVKTRKQNHAAITLNFKHAIKVGIPNWLVATVKVTNSKYSIDVNNQEVTHISKYPLHE